jgi:hypothetical protein
MDVSISPACMSSWPDETSRADCRAIACSGILASSRLSAAPSVTCPLGAGCLVQSAAMIASVSPGFAYDRQFM